MTYPRMTQNLNTFPILAPAHRVDSQHSKLAKTKGNSRQRSREDLLGIGLKYRGLQRVSKLCLVIVPFSQPTPEIPSSSQFP